MKYVSEVKRARGLLGRRCGAFLARSRGRLSRCSRREGLLLGLTKFRFHTHDIRTIRIVKIIVRVS